jgi:hypothetical protein
MSLARSGSMQPVLLPLPFQGTWIVENSPARRTPSHGTHAFGASHAIDFVTNFHNPDRETEESRMSLTKIGLIAAGAAAAGGLEIGGASIASAATATPIPGTSTGADAGRGGSNDTPVTGGEATRRRRGGED